METEYQKAQRRASRAMLATSMEMAHMFGVSWDSIVDLARNKQRFEQEMEEQEKEEKNDY